MLCNDLYGKGTQKGVGICTCITESLGRAPEAEHWKATILQYKILNSETGKQPACIV